MTSTPEQTGISVTANVPQMVELTVEDQRRIRDMVTYLGSCSIAEVLTNALPRGVDGEVIDELAELCEVDHGGIMIVPPSVEAAVDYLRSLWLEPQSPIASTVVRDRLSRRYHLPAATLDVQIVHARLAEASPRIVEVFCTDDRFPALATRNERLGHHETHVGVRLREASDNALGQVRDILTHKAGGLMADGGGYNPAHGEHGCTVMYYRAEGTSQHGWPRRLEVITDGRHEEALQDHLAATADAQTSSGFVSGFTQPARFPTELVVSPPADPDGEDRRLLQLLTGAWAPQMLRAMVVLDLPDHLADGSLTCDELAERCGADPVRLRRLLRALCHPWNGVLQPEGAEGWALTGLGRRLTRTHPATMRHLALLYGGMFYLSWAALVEGVRDGAQPFSTVFGQAPFDYLASHPRQSSIFDAAMAETARFFGQVGTAVDLSAARTVADIGGGKGELVRHLLTTYPGLEARLLDRPGPIGAARVHLGCHGLLGRSTLIEGSFTDPQSVPDADVYLLARVLHDWDDDTCREILRTIRTAGSDDSTLLIIERPLPDDPTDPSVAPLWDLHMLVNNVGGQERTRAQYQLLLEEAGWMVVDERPLSLDMSVIMACPAVVDPTGGSVLPVGMYKYAR